ncbi:MAG: penicillin-binding protein [Oscillospiraceae bacterium]|nr:penicillin-binding protein [Oscillospiraceae bacterium]
MEGNKLRIRTGLIGVLLLAMLAGFVLLLYHYQIVVGVDQETTAAINTYTTKESVPAARGLVTDIDGNVLIGNETVYQVTLDLTDVDDVETQVFMVRRVLQICQEFGIEWNDEMPISRTAPYIFNNTDGEVYSYTNEETGAVTKTRLGRMCEAMGWKEVNSASDLMIEMQDTFGISGLDSDATRSILGVLYSCYLRRNEILWTTYDFADGVNIDFISTVKEEGLPGVSINATSKRIIQTDLASHLLGKVGFITAENWDKGENYKAQGYSMDDVVGLSGVEYAFERYLQGTEGQRTITNDSNGEVIGMEDTLSAVAGQNVALTLDMELQAAAEEALALYVPQLNEGEGGGAAVAIDVNSGAVLACASWPTFNSADMSYDEALESLSPLFNRALQGAYSPGSTYKMVTATAGLESGVITPYSEIMDTGVMDYYGTEFRCWLYRETGETHGMENVSDALRDSCNIFFYQVGLDVGIDKLTEYARAYGLGVDSGIELTEAKGVNAGPEYSESVGTKWYGGNTLSAAIGQSDNLFTPLQIANYVATMVNGGTRYAAHLLYSVTDADGHVTRYQPQVLNTVQLSEQNLAAMKEGMLEVVQRTSTVSEAFALLNENGVRVGAKTGSAQVTGQENANGLFVCFAPYDNPQIAICVAVEKGGAGSATSVIAAHMLEVYFGLEAQLPGDIEGDEDTALPADGLDDDTPDYDVPAEPVEDEPEPEPEIADLPEEPVVPEEPTQPEDGVTEPEPEPETPEEPTQPEDEPEEPETPTGEDNAD